MAPILETVAEPNPALHEANEELLADLDEANDLRVLKDGTRVRVKSGPGNRGLHSDGIAQGALPQIGSPLKTSPNLLGSKVSFRQRLSKSCPQRSKTPTAQAATAHEAYVARVVAAWEELEALTNDSIFRAPRESTQRANRASARPLQQEDSPRDAVLCGFTFTEDDVNWTVLTVTWSPREEEVVVVWYYDADAAAEEEVTK